MCLSLSCMSVCNSKFSLKSNDMHIKAQDVGDYRGELCKPNIDAEIIVHLCSSTVWHVEYLLNKSWTLQLPSAYLWCDVSKITHIYKKILPLATGRYHQNRNSVVPLQTSVPNGWTIVVTSSLVQIWQYVSIRNQIRVRTDLLDILKCFYF